MKDEDIEDVVDGPEENDAEPSHVDGEPTARTPLRAVGDDAMSRGDAAPDPDTDPQLNFFLTDGKFDMKKVVKAGLPVEYRLVIQGKSIDSMKGGLIDPYGPPIDMVMSAVVGDYRPTFIRDENRKVEGLIVYCTLKPFIAQDVASEAGQVLLSEALKGKRVFPALREAVAQADAAA